MVAAASQFLAVRAKGHGKEIMLSLLRGCLAYLSRFRVLSPGCVPQAQRETGSHRGQRTTIGAESDIIDKMGVGLKHNHRLIRHRTAGYARAVAPARPKPKR